MQKTGIPRRKDHDNLVRRVAHIFHSEGFNIDTEQDFILGGRVLTDIDVIAKRDYVTSSTQREDFEVYKTNLTSNPNSDIYFIECKAYDFAKISEEKKLKVITKATDQLSNINGKDTSNYFLAYKENGDLKFMNINTKPKTFNLRELKHSSNKRDSLYEALEDSRPDNLPDFLYDRKAA
ncbi:MAG: hypothetical protein ACMXX7_02390 [Candidatus Woesearchaeota archaeon]